MSLSSNPSPPDGAQPSDHLLRRYPALLRFFLANAGTGFAMQMVSVAVGWQVYALTGSALDLGLIGLAQFFPLVLLALPAGHVADQFPRQRIVLAGLVVEAIAITTLVVLTITQHVNTIAILALLVIIGMAKAFEFPSFQSILPGLVPASVLPRAIALNAAGKQAAMIIGPAVGGFLYLAGPAVVYGLAALMYLMAAALLAGVRYQQAQSRREPATLKTVFAGVHFIRHRPDVLGVISLDLFAVLLGGVTALLPIFARDILQTGPWGLGLLRAAPAIGALSMSLWLARHPLQRRVGMRMFAAVAGYGIATLVFGLSSTLWLSLIALVALGACDMVSVVIRLALVQLDTPDEMRGRVSAVNAIFINTSNQLGEFESGLVAAWLGAVSATVIGGVGTLLVVALWMMMFPTLRKRKRPPPECRRRAIE